MSWMATYRWLAVSFASNTLFCRRKSDAAAAQGIVEAQGRGTVKSIVVSMEDRMGGRKHLTHLSHMESFGLDPDELAAVLQKKWSTSCSVNKLPGKTETGKMLDLQGNLLKVMSLPCMPPPKGCQHKCVHLQRANAFCLSLKISRIDRLSSVKGSSPILRVSALQHASTGIFLRAVPTH